MVNIEKQYTTVTVAMLELGLSRQRVLALVHSGRLKSSRIGGWSIVIDRASLAAYRAAQQRNDAA